MNFWRIQILPITIWLCLLVRPAYGDFKVPELTGPVIDQAKIIDQKTTDILEQLIFQAKEQDIQLQILTLESLQGYPIEMASIKIVETWKLGNNKSDKGVLFLIAPIEKKSRIEVGQGLEGDIPDAIAKRILADDARPYFISNDYSKGILLGSFKILSAAGVDLKNLGTLSELKTKKRNYSLTEVGIILLLVDTIGIIPTFILVLIFLFLMMKFSRHSPLGAGFGGRWGNQNGGWGGGSGSGWSGGGGGFSGGGSSDSW
jgi:uncharacterized protein